MGVALVVAGYVGYIVLDGIAAGLVLFVAGVVLLALGIWGWFDRR